MRTIIYAVFNKETNKRVFSHCKSAECEKFIAEQANPTEFTIRYKWHSF